MWNKPICIVMYACFMFAHAQGGKALLWNKVILGRYYYTTQGKDNTDIPMRNALLPILQWCMGITYILLQVYCQVQEPTLCWLHLVFR